MMYDLENPVDKAVILAAGIGNRIRTVSCDIPKPFLPIDKDNEDFTFIDLHIHNLSKIGVKNLFIVGNEKTYGRKFKHPRDMEVEWILNPSDDLSVSGSAHSAWYAWNSHFNILDGKSRVILMDADIVYTPEILFKLARSRQVESKTLVCQTFKKDNEEILVFCRDGIPRFHGKGLLNNVLTNGYECIGEATGILLFESRDHAIIRDLNHWLIHYSSAKTLVEHEDLTQYLMHMNLLRAVTFEKEIEFMECDTPEDYKILLNHTFPKIKKLIFN